VGHGVDEFVDALVVVGETGLAQQDPGDRQRRA
jgi:hypothetical protein